MIIYYLFSETVALMYKMTSGFHERYQNIVLFRGGLFSAGVSWDKNYPHLYLGGGMSKRIVSLVLWVVHRILYNVSEP